VERYLSALMKGRPEHHVGHNPAGALAIVALLALALLIGATGWASYNEVGGEWLEEGHELVANLMMALVGLHLAAVVLSSWLHRENLVRAMVSGYKPGRPEDGVRSAWFSVAALMLVAVLGFWVMQWQGRYQGDQHAAAAADGSSVAQIAGAPGAQAEGPGQPGTVAAGTGRRGRADRDGDDD
jgi:hypothetical protein